MKRATDRCRSWRTCPAGFSVASAMGRSVSEKCEHAPTGSPWGGTQTGSSGGNIFLMRKLLLIALVSASACAPKIVPAPVVTAPKFPEFTRPAVPPALGGGPAAENASRGWTFLQAGDLKAAE